MGTKHAFVDVEVPIATFNLCQAVLHGNLMYF